ncbi:hypothetical protein ACS0TY_005513 [Phlomoides rotata]
MKILSYNTRGLGKKVKRKEYSEACICVVGDFNAIRSPKERVGRGEVGDTRDMAYFDEFISQSILVDMPLSGRTFTCYRPDGTCKSMEQGGLWDRIDLWIRTLLISSERLIYGTELTTHLSLRKMK